MLCDYWEWRTSAAGMSWAAKQYGSSLYAGEGRSGDFARTTMFVRDAHLRLHASAPAGVEARLPPGVDARTALETPRHTAYANLAKEAKAGVSLCTDGATSAAGAASSKSASSAAASSSSAAAAGSCADTVVMPVDPGACGRCMMHAVAFTFPHEDSIPSVVDAFTTCRLHACGAGCDRPLQGALGRLPHPERGDAGAGPRHVHLRVQQRSW